MKNIHFSSAVVELKPQVTSDELGNVFIELKSDGNIGQIHYTLDGSSPTVTSPVFSGRLKADLNGTCLQKISEEPTVARHERKRN